jgi:hypothetical protein
MELGHDFEICTSEITDERELLDKVSRAEVLIIANSPPSGEVIRS